MEGIISHACHAKVENLEEAMKKFKEHTLRGKGVTTPDDWKVRYVAFPLLVVHTNFEVYSIMQADYVELISKTAELRRLQRAGAGLATIDSAMASLLMVRAYSKKDMDKIEGLISRLEVDHGIRERWRLDQPDFKAGFEILRKRSISR